MGQIIAIVSGKGGAGKSTIACALGAALARRGKRVLCVDFDAGLRSLDIMLGIDSSVVYDLSDLLEKGCDWKQVLYRCEHQQGLYALPAPSRADFVFSLPEVRRVMLEAASVFDYVLADSPAGLGNGFTASAIAASTVLVVATADPVCVRDARKVSDMLFSMNKENVRLVVNRMKKRFFQKGLMSDLDQVIDLSGLQLISVVPDWPDVALHIMNGQLKGKNSPFFKEIEALAARIEGEEISLHL